MCHVKMPGLSTYVFVLHFRGLLWPTFRQHETKPEAPLSKRKSSVGRGHLRTKEVVLVAQEITVKKWRNAPERGIVQACLLELEMRKEQHGQLHFSFQTCRQGILTLISCFKYFFPFEVNVIDIF